MLTDTIQDMDPVNLTLRIERDMLTTIERMAEADQRTKSSMVRVLLTEAIKAREGK